MRIIPVLDIRGGAVVHAVAGARKSYRPIESKVTSSVEPTAVARDLLDFYPFGEIYIADLDAIEGRGSNLGEALSIRDLGVVVYLDCGIGGVADMEPDLRKIPRVVVGTETLGSVGELEVICRMHPYVVASLDYRGDDLLARDRSLGGIAVHKLVNRLCGLGISEAIYLDLLKVGTDSGFRAGRVRSIVRASSVPVLIGGGLRDADQIRAAGELGAAGVLVATSIHSGRLTRQEMADLCDTKDGNLS